MTDYASTVYPPLTRAMARMIGRTFTSTDAAARRNLGYVGQVSTAENLKAYG